MKRKPPNPTWNTRASTYPTFLRFAIPVATVLLAFGIKLQLESLFHLETPYLVFFASIMISAWYGGFKTSLLATVLSTVLIFYFFLHPDHNSFIIHNIKEAIEISIFLIEGILISVLSQFAHNALRKSEIKNIELKRSREHYKLVVDAVKDYAIYTLDPDGYITSWNKGAKRIKGYKAKEIIGKHFSIFYPQERINKKDPWNVLEIAEEKGRFEDEGLRIKKDGSAFWADVVITSLMDDQGKLQGFSQITRDMTKHRELDKRKDEFISIASHELKTPITSIKVFNQIMQKLSLQRKDKEFQHYLNRMEGQIDRLNEIITDLLDVSKIQAGKLEFKKDLFNLNDLTREIVEDIQTTTKKHRIIIEGKSLKKIFGDKDRIGQVLTNFLTNAIKYSPNTDKIVVKIIPQKNRVMVGVQDFGIGISKEDQEKIFERFYRVYSGDEKTFPGLGMGLYISSDIIERHNGKIWVESEKGKGSTFYFTLFYTKT